MESGHGRRNLCFQKERWDVLVFQPLIQATLPDSHFPTPDPGPPSSAWAEMGLKQEVRALPLRSLEGSRRDDGRPFQH